MALLADKGPKGAQAFVESLAEEDKEFSEDLPPQYLVLTWQNLDLAYWISHFGNWDLVEGKDNPYRIRQVRGEASFNTRRGDDPHAPGQTLEIRGALRPRPGPRQVDREKR